MCSEFLFRERDWPHIIGARITRHYKTAFMSHLREESSSMIGKTLGNFECTALLGRGGMGKVYQAKDQKLGRDVAIKVLPEEFAKDTERGCVVSARSETSRIPQSSEYRIYLRSGGIRRKVFPGSETSRRRNTLRTAEEKS